MKTLLIATGLTVVTATALADIPLGRGEVSSSVTDTAAYDSNLFGTPNATGDFLNTLTPSVSYLDQSALIETQADVGLALIRYWDQNQLNANNWNADASLRINDAGLRNYSGLVKAGYAETSELDQDLNARINAKTTTLVGQAALVTGPRSDVALSANYSDALRVGASSQQTLGTEALYHYKDFFYGNSLRLAADYGVLHSSGDNFLNVPLDQTSYELAAGFYRAFYHDVLNVGLNYGYRVVDLSQAETSAGSRRQGGSVISATMDGPFLPAQYFPKIQSHFALAYESAATPGLGDTGGKELTGSLSLAWQARETTSVTFVASRTQRLAANDLSVVDSSVQLGLQQDLRYNLEGNLTVGYDWASYRATDRQDQTVTFTAGLKYNFARSWDAQLSYAVNSTSSSVASSRYDRYLINLSVSYHF